MSRLVLAALAALILAPPTTAWAQDEVPPGDVRDRINSMIFDELVYGQFNGPTRSYFAQVIADGRQRGCDAVVLGCTEIPLLITQADSVLPILDSTRILARAALRESRR